MFTIQGEFDVSRFQLVVFSLVVGVSMIQTGLTELATFTIPDSLLGLLGLSQATYVLQKAVGPNNVDGLDKSIRELRAMEDAFALRAGQQEDPAPAAGQVAVPPPLSTSPAPGDGQEQSTQALRRQGGRNADDILSHLWHQAQPYAAAVRLTAVQAASVNATAL